MKRLIFLFITIFICSLLFAQNAPYVYNVTGSQRTDGSKIVDIYYNILEPDGDTLRVTLQVSDDDGSTWSIIPADSLLSGDIGDGILTGTGKHIIWNAGEETIFFEGTTYKFKVIADDDPNPPVPEGFVFVEGGTFSMGDHFSEGGSDELPLHDVTLNDFYLAETEVTHQQVIDVFNWAYGQGYINCSSSTVTNAQGNSQELLDLDDSDCAIDWNGSSLVFGGSSYASSANCPCIEITWYGSIAYANYKSLQEGLDVFYDLSDWSCNWSANGYRLPTEAEWEYAARGGINHTDDFRYSGCHNEGDLTDYAWYSANNSPNGTKEVGTKLANQLGLFDMSGNVYEWCWDWYDSNYYSSSPSSNPTGPGSGSYRVGRGGGWNRSAYSCRVAYRYSYSRYPTGSSDGIGFRILRKIP